MIETPQPNGLRKFLYNNLFRIIVILVAGIAGWTTFQFKIQANTEAIAGVAEEVEEVMEDVAAVSNAVQEIQIDIAEINTSLKFIGKTLGK